eukprot:2748685-Prymnesium_polylepis.1
MAATTWPFSGGCSSFWRRLVEYTLKLCSSAASPSSRRHSLSSAGSSSRPVPSAMPARSKSLQLPCSEDGARPLTKWPHAAASKAARTSSSASTDT